MIGGRDEFLSIHNINFSQSYKAETIRNRVLRSVLFFH